MTNRLDSIILQKQQEVAALQYLVKSLPQHDIAKVIRGEAKRESQKSFKKALRHTTLSIIAEIKRKSPSKGELAPITNSTELALTYVNGGANALSILTDETFFGGSLNDLRQVSIELHSNVTPILRKDFIIDVIQIAESVVYGADAILAIVAVLGKKTKTILENARNFGIEVIVEVHNHRELEIALECNAEIIGINNRDLFTFNVDTQRSFELIRNIPKNIIKVAESGIKTPALAHQYYLAGFDAVLIGESLVRSSRPDLFINECHYG